MIWAALFIAFVGLLLGVIKRCRIERPPTPWHKRPPS